MLRGLAASDDSRFSDGKRQREELAGVKTSDVCKEKVDPRAVDPRAVERFVEKELKKVLGFEDDIMAATIVNQIVESEQEQLQAKEIQLFLKSIMDAEKAKVFTEALWQVLLDFQPERVARRKKEEQEERAKRKNEGARGNNRRYEPRDRRAWPDRKRSWRERPDQESGSQRKHSRNELDSFLGRDGDRRIAQKRLVTELQSKVLAMPENNHLGEEERRQLGDDLVKARKLLLVVNIDHVLLHAVAVSEEEKGLVREQKLERLVETIAHEHMAVLRPGLDRWLYDVSANFILVAYSKSNQKIATDMIRFIDPHERYFGGRVFCIHPTRKNKLDELINVDASHVVVVDSSTSEWCETTRGNLLTVRPFRIFKETCLMGPEYDPTGEHELRMKDLRDSKRLDHGLYRAREILEWVHRNAFPRRPPQEDKRSHPDTKALLAKVRNSILERFVVITNVQDVKAKGLECGARVLDSFETFDARKIDRKEDVVVIAGSTQDKLAVQANEKGLQVLKPEWLYASWHFWVIPPSTTPFKHD